MASATPDLRCLGVMGRWVLGALVDLTVYANNVGYGSRVPQQVLDCKTNTGTWR
jgi:hypothetical protein